MIIIETCMKHSDKLYEKFSSSVDRKTQSNSWSIVADELKKEGINVPSVHKLKQNVSNWIRRATVSSLIN